MAAIVGLDHVQLAMPLGGEDAAREFYAAILGLSEVPKPAPLAARGGCWFAAGSVQLHLGIEAGFRPAKKAHPALLVDDLRGFAERIEATGLALQWDHELPGVLRCNVDDPFGNRIEFVQA